MAIQNHLSSCDLIVLILESFLIKKNLEEKQLYCTKHLFAVLLCTSKRPWSGIDIADIGRLSYFWIWHMAFFHFAMYVIHKLVFVQISSWMKNFIAYFWKFLVISIQRMAATVKYSKNWKCLRRQICLLWLNLEDTSLVQPGPECKHFGPETIFFFLIFVFFLLPFCLQHLWLWRHSWLSWDIHAAHVLAANSGKRIEAAYARHCLSRHYP